VPSYRILNIPTKYETKLLAFTADSICTSGYITKVWNLTNGELLMSVSHGENVKATAVAFKPPSQAGQDAQRLWLGTNHGELLELDIPTGATIVTKAAAHNRAVTKIHRVFSAMWTMEEDGKVLIWPPGDDGTPSLAQAPFVAHLGPNAGYSLMANGQLWVAYGKDLHVFEYDSKMHTLLQVSPQALTQPNVGEVTSGTTVSTKPDLIYFGHNDGKVTVYSRKDFSCVGMIPISLYRISALLGVGNYLWASFNTGMLYVYDMATHPWKVMKDWKAHESTIAGLQVDRPTLWHHQELPVVTLGTDGFIKIWDGLMTEDWLGMAAVRIDRQTLTNVRRGRLAGP
jgi:hypothetical protein